MPRSSKCVPSKCPETRSGISKSTPSTAQTFKHILLPVWLLSYTYGTKNYQVAVNGHTGKITGEYPISWVKVAIVTLLALIAILIFISLQEQ